MAKILLLKKGEKPNKRKTLFFIKAKKILFKISLILNAILILYVLNMHNIIDLTNIFENISY